MCDFRAYLGYATDKETGERIDIPARGPAYVIRKHKEKGWLQDWIKLGFDPPVYGEDSPIAGLYNVCASGGFFSYYDGDQWESVYSHPKLEFAFSDENCGSYLSSLPNPHAVPYTKPDGTTL